jgi:anti-sigma B factor antagonist
MYFKVTVEPMSEHLQILHLEGRLTLDGGAYALSAALEKISAPGDKLILDLAGVEYIDSTGVGVLVSAFMGAKKLGQRIVLAALGERVRDTLRLTKLSTIFDVYDSVDEARAALAGS